MCKWKFPNDQKSSFLAEAEDGYPGICFFLPSVVLLLLCEDQRTAVESVFQYVERNPKMWNIYGASAAVLDKKVDTVTCYWEPPIADLKESSKV